MTLHGPADAEAFRVKVGRFHDRHYHDPLPADKTWATTADVWPSVSTVKKADVRDWSFVSLGRAARYVADRPGCLDGLDLDEINERFKYANRRGLDNAATRGTKIHKVAEELGRGTYTPGLISADDDAAPYIPAVQAFMDDHSPEFLLSEGVVINRTVGYGGTFDAVVKIAGKTYMVDWKTRSNEHAAYPQEGAQLAAYAHGDYVIIETDGRASRVALPPLDGYLIVSIHPTGYRLYPVNEAKAWDHFTNLHRWWTVKRDESSVVDKPVILAGPVGTAGTPKRKRAPKTVPQDAPGSTNDEPSIAGPTVQGSAPVEQDDPPTIDDDARTILAQLHSLSDLTRAHVLKWGKEARAAGFPIDVKTDPDDRKIAVLAAMVAWAPFPDLARGAVAAVIGGEGGDSATVPTGVLFSLLTVEQAQALIGGPT